MLGFRRKLAAKKHRETHFLSNQEKLKWIVYSVERETAGVRKQVEDAEAVVWQVQEELNHAETVGLATKEPEKMLEEILDAIGDSLSDLSSSNDGEVGEHDDDEEIEVGKLSEDDEPSWVMGRITNMVQQ
jgi:hypothetical protein